jgi:hypothetical protein
MADKFDVYLVKDDNYQMSTDNYQIILYNTH